MSIEEKLKLYGKQKLSILAKRKNIKNYSKLSKNELINELSPITKDHDLPIKS